MLTSLRLRLIASYIIIILIYSFIYCVIDVVVVVGFVEKWKVAELRERETSGWGSNARRHSL